MMMIEYGLGAVHVMVYVLAWMAPAPLGLEVVPRRRFNAMPLASADADDRSGREKSTQPELVAKNGWSEEGAHPSSLRPLQMQDKSRPPSAAEARCGNHQ